MTQSGGILRHQGCQAFQAGTTGETIAALSDYGDRIIEVPGKRGLNAFTQTDLSASLPITAQRTWSWPNGDVDHHRFHRSSGVRAGQVGRGAR